MRHNSLMVRLLSPYTIFFFSGLAGLIYEIVWSRQLILIFGNTTHSVVTVITAFMAGLGAGSYFFGKVADRVENNLRLYAFLEIGVGISGLLSLYTFNLIKSSYEILLLDFTGQTLLKVLLTDSSLLILKFLLCFFAMLPTTFLMGATLPVLVRHLTSISSNLAREVSRLYFANTLGAFFGVLLAGFIFIETFGLKESIMMAALINIFLAGIILFFPNYTAFFLKIYRPKRAIKAGQEISWETYSSYSKSVVLAAFGISGMVSMIYQVLWVRLLTPGTGTYIYAFTTILALFLLGIAIGSYIFHEMLIRIKKTLLLFGLIEMGIGLFAFASVFVNSSLQALDIKSRLVLTIFPATVLMGMTFPVVSKVFEKSKKVGRVIGGVYAVNTSGSILGTLLSSFFVIPSFGSAKGIISFSLLNLFVGLVLIFRQFSISAMKGATSLFFVPPLIFLLIWIAKVPETRLLPVELREVIRRLEAAGDYEIVFREDEVASILGYRQIGGINRGLIIDGVPTTYLGPETSLLAHIPLSLHPHPQNMLVVALGMGRTYRSALLHGSVYVDAVELVPSVPRLIYLFHDDANLLLKNSRGRIVVNDGRNYVRTTSRKYDVIVVDPPPPVNAAGTTVLYSKEFYLDSKRILEKGGIFVAWLFAATRTDDFKMLVKSFYDVFDEVLVLRSPQGSGYYLIGSDAELSWESQVLKEKFDSLNLLEDINNPRLFDLHGNPQDKLSFEDINKGFIGEKEVLTRFVENVPQVTDNNPRTEYFLLRYMRRYEPMMWEADILTGTREAFSKYD